MLSAYHIGSHDTINETYRKIFRWADNHGYKCGNSSIERYVTDYWTIRKSRDFVTEIFVDVYKRQLLMAFAVLGGVYALCRQRKAR